MGVEPIRQPTPQARSESLTSSNRSGLTVVGVGPGDPELITVAAQRAIAAATVVAYPVAALDRLGMAAQIAQPWLAPTQKRLPLLFPMVQEAEPRQQAWQQAARAVAAEVTAGERVVFLCEGDCSLFASSSYLLLALKAEAPELAVRVIPGITAASATAAAARWPLALQGEQLQVVPLPDEPDQARQLLIAARDQGQPMVLLKVGRRWRWLRPLLEELQLLESALYGERVGWPDQLLSPAAAIAAGERPYFSLVLLRPAWPVVLPWA